MVDDVAVLDHDMALGFEPTVQFRTSVFPLSGGREQRNKNWTDPRRTYRFSFLGHTVEELRALQEFFYGRRGAHRTWLLYDWLDHKVENEVIGTGDGIDTTFTLIKTYDAVNPYVRTIRNIVGSVPTVTVNNVAVSVTSFSNGTITLTSPPGAGTTIRATCEFYVPVRFVEDAFSATVDGNPNTDDEDTGFWGSTGELNAIEVLPL